MATLLHIKDLVKNYGEKKVLSSVTYSFEEGKIYSILGLVSASPCLPEFLTGYEFISFSGKFKSSFTLFL